MTDDPSAPATDVVSVAALAEPVRRALYDVVVAADEPLGREEVAARADVAVHTARFHLDRLVADGLLDVEYRRLSGRTGPGAGRPAKLYRRAPREIAVSLPSRHYDLLSRILATAVAESVGTADPVLSVVDRVAHREGEAHGAAFAGVGDDLARMVPALADGGYEPQVEGGEVRVRNCPFHRAAQEQTALVCALNLAYVEGVRTGLACTSLDTRLEPTPEHCCVVVGPR